jgi:hypothetical protein
MRDPCDHEALFQIKGSYRRFRVRQGAGRELNSFAAGSSKRATILLAYLEDPLLFAIGRALGLIIKSSRAAFYGLWSKARWLRRTTAGALAGRDF